MRRTLFQPPRGDLPRRNAEQRALVADAEGLQPLQLFGEGEAKPVARLFADGDGRLEVGGGIMRADIGVQRLCQRLELVAADVDARRLRVAAELGDVIGARLQRFIDIDIFDRGWRGG